MAFVDEWDEVKALVSDEQIVNVTGSGRGQLINTADRSCVGEHAFATKKTADGWMLVCASCGKVDKDFGVGANIEKFMPAEILKDVRTDSDGKIDLAFMEENGESFIRLSNLIPNGAGWMGLTFVNGEANVTGQYMIMKVRLGENELGTSYLQMYTGTTIGLKAEGQATSFKMVEDGQWHYVVVDLASRMGDPDTYLVPNADKTYTVKYLQIRPFSGTQCYYPKGEDGKYPQRVMEDDYLDIGFIAYCDSMDDFKDIIDSESYEWSVSTGESSIRKTKDHSCVTHSVSVEITGTSQKAVCVFCGEVMRDFTLPESINWYATYSDAKTYQASVAKEMYDEETGLVFNRFTGSSGGHLNITGGSGSGAATEEEYEIGNYLVIKYRVTDADIIVRVGSKNESGFYTSLGDYQKDLPGNDWMVAVISLENVEAFKNDADGMSTVYVMLTTAVSTGATSYTVDIAYVAMVDTIDEMKLLLEDGETYLDCGAKFNGTAIEYNKDGTKVPCKTCTPSTTATVVDGNDGAKIYNYNCTVCGNTAYSKTVSTGVIYLAPELIKTTSGGTIVNPNTESANSPEVYAEKNTLDPSTHFGMTSIGCAYDSLVYFGFKGNNASHKIGQLIWNRSYEDYTSNASANGRYTLDMGETRFLVLKVRTNLTENDGSEFLVNISTAGQVGGTVKLPVKELQGDWVTYVIDLETVLPEKWVKDAETGTYVMDSFYLNFYNFLTTNSVDIAYIAFVEGDWADVDSLVDEDTVVNVTSASDVTYEIVMADGTGLVLPTQND